ncbi:MAG TPA: hypothetical protein VD884_15745 [Ohtaekwangia sp.]|nr:hypothetical protein [Ohtaekwangia sp.]
MKRNTLVVLILLALSFGCSDSNEPATKKTQQSDGEKINLMVESIQPIFASLRTKANGREEPKAITYEVVTDLATGEMTLLNFKLEEFFPIAGRAAYAKEGTKYTVECTVGGKTTSKTCDGKFSCGSAIADCLDKGGCATICEAPKGYNVIRDSDLKFFIDQGVSVNDLKRITGLPTLDLERARATGTLASVKLTSLIF